MQRWVIVLSTDGTTLPLQKLLPSRLQEPDMVPVRSQLPSGKTCSHLLDRPSLESLEVTMEAAISTGRLGLPAASRCAYSQPYSSLTVWASWEPHGVAGPVKAERTCFFSLSAFHLTLTPVTPALSDPRPPSDPSPEMPLEMALIITRP